MKPYMRECRYDGKCKNMAQVGRYCIDHDHLRHKPSGVEMKRETKVPGQKDQHRIVTNQCFKNRGLSGVLEEVNKSVNESITALEKVIPATSKIHVVVTVEHE